MPTRVCGTSLWCMARGPGGRGDPPPGVSLGAVEQSWFRPLAATALTALALGAAGCGKSSKEAVKAPEFPTVGAKGEKKQAAAELGFPVFATKNTTRVGGADPIADAAATARAVFPAVTPATRPKVVALVDGHDWRTAIAASALM